jgi:2-desacetyl-2-hydroxyethyl bacteriochlorophyllide A dehydrogenase
MQGLLYAAPNRLELRELAEPQPARDEVLVQVIAAGICGSDLHAFKGHDPRRVPPMVLGHEFVGRILGGPRAGERITANPLATCARCSYCREGRTNLCTDRRMIGMNLPGAFAERLAVPEQCLIALPATLSDRAAAVTEPAATVVHALTLAARASVRPLPACRALVIGAGAIGLLAVLSLQSEGNALTVVEASPLRREALQGATGIVALDAQAVKPGEFDLVIDAVGAVATRDLAIRAVAAGGVVVHVGLADWDSALDWRALTLREITLIGCYTYSSDDLRAAVDALDRGRFGSLAWVEEHALADGPDIMTALAEGRVAAPKVLLRPPSGFA